MIDLTNTTLELYIYNDRRNNASAPKRGYVRHNGSFIRPTSRTGKGSGGHDVYRLELREGDTLDARACSNTRGQKNRWSMRMTWARLENRDGELVALDFDGNVIAKPDWVWLCPNAELDDEA